VSKLFKIYIFIALAVALGLGSFSLYEGRAHSYLSNDSQTCVNCHVMNTQFETWRHSSHKNVTSCNDCHVPHENFMKTYAFKASDGMRHSFMFTMRLEPEVITIKDAGREVVQSNCLRCHEQMFTEAIKSSSESFKELHSGGRVCWECHREVPHGKVRSLSTYDNLPAQDRRRRLSA
jgi:cytochrome c nitrite reductase small subunit